MLGGTKQVMNVAELLEQQFGVKTTHNVNPEVDQVATTVTKILSYNPRRLAFIMVNLGANEVCIAPDAGVLLTRGIYLAKTGGTLTIVWTEDFEMPTFEWYGIANTAAANFYVLEVLTM